ncbi:hypothetical protein HK405_007978, partial [Cladochytrium tenue]
ATARRWPAAVACITTWALCRKVAGTRSRGGQPGTGRTACVQEANGAGISASTAAIATSDRTST